MPLVLFNVQLQCSYYRWWYFLDGFNLFHLWVAWQGRGPDRRELMMLEDNLLCLPGMYSVLRSNYASSSAQRVKGPDNFSLRPDNFMKYSTKHDNSLFTGGHYEPHIDGMVKCAFQRYWYFGDPIKAYIHEVLFPRVRTWAPCFLEDMCEEASWLRDKGFSLSKASSASTTHLETIFPD